MQTKSAVTVPTAAAAAGHYLQQHVHQYQPTGAAYASDYSNEISGSVRMGPDGEDNSGGDGSKDRQQHLYGGQHMHQQQQHHHQQQQQRAAALQKRHSVILERAFDFGECKTIIPYFKKAQTTRIHISLLISTHS